MRAKETLCELRGGTMRSLTTQKIATSLLVIVMMVLLYVLIIAPVQLNHLIDYDERRMTQFTLLLVSVIFLLLPSFRFFLGSLVKGYKKVFALFDLILICGLISAHSSAIPYISYTVVSQYCLLFLVGILFTWLVAQDTVNIRWFMYLAVIAFISLALLVAHGYWSFI